MIRSRGRSWQERLPRHWQWAWRVGPGIVMVPVVAGSATAMWPAVGAVIAVVFWAVAAAGVVTLVVPVVRWSAPLARVVAGWLRVRVLPAADTWRRGWARAWRVLLLRVRMRGRRAQVLRGPRAISAGRVLVRPLPPGPTPPS